MFKKIKPSKVLEDYISEKIKRECHKFSLNIIQATVVLSQSGNEYTASCNIVGNVLKLHLEAKGSETHAAIDAMVHKLHLSLQKNKEKRRQHGQQSREVLAKMKKNPADVYDMDWD